jgi:hypothetical protein
MAERFARGRSSVRRVAVTLVLVIAVTPLGNDVRVWVLD